uniref:RING-type domain-containing protein n=1 Tax=Takifugu rubripes TaxID=31033 RepID=A0A3B5JYT9_TAKRU
SGAPSLNRWPDINYMASSCEDLLMCPICLLTYTEPITTPCGHNYCKACITEYLSYTDEPVCPLCKEALQTQSELKVNTALQNLVQHFSNITVSDGETPAEAWEVTCDMSLYLNTSFEPVATRWRPDPS